MHAAADCQEIKNPGVLGPFFSSSGAKTQVKMSLLPSDLGGYWNRCGLTADFGAAFLSFCHPNSNGAKNTLSFILNELVENAVKFSSKEHDHVITINLYETDAWVVFEVENSVNLQQLNAYLDFYRSNLMAAIDENQYTELLMKQADESSGSHLGLITILKDFQAQISLRYYGPAADNTYVVTTQVTINPTEI